MQHTIVHDWTMSDQESEQEEKRDVHTSQRTPYQALQAGTYVVLTQVFVHAL